MGLIRHAQLAQVVRDAIVLDMGDINAQAEHVRTAAQAEARRIVAEGHTQAEQIRRDTHAQAAHDGQQDGYAAGLEAGRAAGHTEAYNEHKPQLESLAQHWQTALSEFNARRDEMLLAARSDVLRLALLIAERVTRRQIAVDPRAVVAQLAAVLELVASPTRLALTVHPDDAPLVREALPSLVAAFDGSDHAQVIADPGLERGSVVAHTGSGGTIDASIATQLDRIVAELLPPLDVDPPAGGRHGDGR